MIAFYTLLTSLFYIHTICYTVISMLALTTCNPVHLILTKSARRVWPVSRRCLYNYSSAAPDRTFAFAGGLCYPQSILYLYFDNDIVNFAIIKVKYAISLPLKLGFFLFHSGHKQTVSNVYQAWFWLNRIILLVSYLCVNYVNNYHLRLVPCLHKEEFWDAVSHL
jgi:hypothetical protein